MAVEQALRSGKLISLLNLLNHKTSFRVSCSLTLGRASVTTSPALGSTFPIGVTTATATVRGFISGIVCADRILAQVAINDAVSHGGNAKDIATAKKKLANGDHDALKKKYEAAIEDYKEAWELLNRKDD